MTAVVLAGGRSRRMEGQDKGLMQVQGIPLIRRVINRIKPQVADILISANRNIAEYSLLGLPVLEDLQASFAGPLAGVLRAMDYMGDGTLMVVPCDMPLIPANIVSRLATCLSDSNADACCVKEHDRLQPLVCVLRTSLRDNLYTFLSQGNHKVRDWLELQNLTTLDYPEGSGCFMNINTRDELIAFENRYYGEQ